MKGKHWFNVAQSRSDCVTTSGLPSMQRYELQHLVSSVKRADHELGAIIARRKSFDIRDCCYSSERLQHGHDWALYSIVV
jgi:hypothetical protein